MIADRETTETQRTQGFDSSEKRPLCSLCLCGSLIEPLHA